MKLLICFNALLICWVHAEDVRLLDLDPPEAQSIIDSKDQTLKYAPKIESNVPAIRYLGNEPHHVQEDIYLANQYHGQDGVGGYLYGYSVPDISKTEKKKAGGDLTGAYNYIAGNGQEIKVEYWDNGNGFHQIDNVPKILPKQIDDSPEVKAAKEEHARIWAAEAERNSKPIQNPYPSARPGAYAGLGAGVGAGVGAATGYSAVSGLSQGAPKYGSPSLGPGGAQPGFAGNPGYAGQSGSFGAFGGSKPGFGGSQGGAFGGSKPGFGGSQGGAFGGSQGGAFGGSQGGAFGGSQGGAFGSGSKPGFGGSQGGFGKSNQNNIDYSGQYSENQQSFAANPQAQKKDHDDGSWDESQTEEPQGPPKGFFYNIDYPVGIIVSKDGQQKRESLSEVYNSNKALLDQQLKGGAAVHGGATYPNYQVHA